jgi:hypothetical protein
METNIGTLSLDVLSPVRITANKTNVENDSLIKNSKAVSYFLLTPE